MDGNFFDNDYYNIIEAAPSSLGGHTDESAAAQQRGLLDKYDKFALRIKFSRALDPNSVKLGSATVLSGNKKIKTSVEYDKKRRSIIISPKSRYLRNTLYFLKLSGSVMSESGRSLRENRFFVFKQDGKSLDFYRSPRAAGTEAAPDTLDRHRNFFLPVFFTISALVIVFSYFYANKTGIALGTALVFTATAAAVIDSISDIGRSNREYAYGAKLYNNGLFFDALQYFELSLHYNPDNIYSQEGLDAAIIKCSELDD